MPDGNTVRFTTDAPDSDTAGRDGSIITPVTRFGSAHATSFQAAACDGAVHTVAYTIDPRVRRKLGNRRDSTSPDNGPLATWE